MGVLVVGMFVMNYFAKKSAAKRKAEQDRTMAEQMVPGAWVQTFSGFFGRFVDVDGDVIILETPGGEETYWVKAAVRAVTDPPFEAIAEADDDDVEIIDATTTVDSLDAAPADSDYLSAEDASAQGTDSAADSDSSADSEPRN